MVYSLTLVVLTDWFTLLTSRGAELTIRKKSLNWIRKSTWLSLTSTITRNVSPLALSNLLLTHGIHWIRISKLVTK